MFRSTLARRKMPIYEFKCKKCGFIDDRLLPKIEDRVICLHCGGEMGRLPTFPALVKYRGDGLYPSRRKENIGTAPYSV